MDGRMQLCRSRWVQGLPASSCWGWEVEGCLLACRICALVEDLCQEEKLLLEEVCRFCSIRDIRERLIGSSLRSWRHKSLNLQLYWKEGPSESILNRFGNGDSFDVQGWKHNFWCGVLLFLILKRISQLGMWRSGQAWLQWPWDSEVLYPESTYVERASVLFVVWTALGFRRPVFILFRKKENVLLGKISWEVVLQRRGVQENRLIFKAHLLLKQSIPTCRKSGSSSRRPAWMNKKLQPTGKRTRGRRRVRWHRSRFNTRVKKSKLNLVRNGRGDQARLL